jgi:CDP-diacylglycerol--serine O-phosphatidyltransferase
MFRIPPARFILPNLFTLAAFFCGFALIWKAGEAEEARHFYLAATLIPLAALFDGFDGRVARLVQGSSKFGVQYDSLSDLVAFGVGPAILMYYWALHELGTVGLVISFLFAAAAMTRLARFNVTAEEEGGCSRYFEGLPSPFAGLTIGALIGVQAGLLGMSSPPEASIPFLALFVIIVAALMVSQVRFRTFKDLQFTPRVRLITAALLATIVILSVRFDFMVALAFGLGTYIASAIAGSALRRGRAFVVARTNDPFGSPFPPIEIEEEVDDEDDDLRPAA